MGILKKNSLFEKSTNHCNFTDSAFISSTGAYEKKVTFESLTLYFCEKTKMGKNNTKKIIFIFILKQILYLY